MTYIFLCIIMILFICVIELLVYGAIESALMRGKYFSFIIGLVYMLVFAITIIEAIKSVINKIKEKESTNDK